MLVENILAVMFNVLYGLLDKLPFMNIEVKASVIKSFVDYIAVASYFVPLDTVLVLLSAIVLEEMFKIGLSLIKLIWHFVPILGN